MEEPLREKHLPYYAECDRRDRRRLGNPPRTACVQPFCEATGYNGKGRQFQGEDRTRLCFEVTRWTLLKALGFSRKGRATELLGHMVRAVQS